MTDESLMPFGKHKGKAMANVPAAYLLWLYENASDLRGPLRTYIETNLDVIRKQVAYEKKKNSR